MVSRLGLFVPLGLDNFELDNEVDNFELSKDKGREAVLPPPPNVARVKGSAVAQPELW